MITASSTTFFLNTNIGAIQALSTVVLVLVTLYYAYQTRQTVKEAAKSRRDVRLPIIRIGMKGPIEIGRDGEGRPKKFIELSFENIGYGLARNIKALFFKRSPAEIENLKEGEDDKLLIELEFNEEQIINNLPEEKKIIIIKYDDIFGREIATVAHFGHNHHHGHWISFDIVNWHPILPK